MEKDALDLWVINTCQDGLTGHLHAVYSISQHAVLSTWPVRFLKETQGFTDVFSVLKEAGWLRRQD